MQNRKKTPIFYGWIIAVIAFINMALVYGVRFSFPVFYVTILDEFGWTRASTAGIYSLNILTYGLSAPIVGLLIDRLGPRKVVPLGAAVLALGTAACSLANTVWHFYFFFGIVVGFGTACAGYVPHSTIISNWFARRRATAIGIVLAGNGASFLIGALAEPMISHLGWRGAYIALAILPIAIVIPLAIIFERHRPEDMGLVPDGITRRDELKPTPGITEKAPVLDTEWASQEWTLAKAIKTYRFWLMFFTSFCMFGIGLQILVAHQIALMVDIGYSQTFAASVYGLFGIISILGRLSGFVCDRIGREKAFTIGWGAAVLALSLLFFVMTSDTSYPWILYLYGILFGLCAGLVPTAHVSAAADLFQGRNFGLINGVITLGFGIGGTIGPWLGGYIFDMTGNYELAIAVVLFGISLAVTLIWLAAPRKVRPVGGTARGIVR